jgi:hypothetical protein
MMSQIFEISRQQLAPNAKKYVRGFALFQAQSCSGELEELVIPLLKTHEDNITTIYG